MGWSVGYDPSWHRDIGYGVPGECDQPNCHTEIDRGLAHVCGDDVYGGEDGCGLFFCSGHLTYNQNGKQVCERCENGPAEKPFDPTPDVPMWNKWKLNHESWAEWRKENPQEVERLRSLL